MSVFQLSNVRVSNKVTQILSQITFYLLLDCTCMHWTFVQSERIFILKRTLLIMESKGPKGLSILWECP